MRRMGCRQKRKWKLKFPPLLSPVRVTGKVVRKRGSRVHHVSKDPVVEYKKGV